MTPLGWVLLDEINVGDRWTVLGDLNQRRSDHTPSNWPEILDLIAIDEDTPIRELAIGYRSTWPILEFAARLLPKGERAITAFQQHGPAPTVEKVRPTEIGDAVTAQVERLLTAYPLGTVAVVGPDTSAVRKSLRSRGWIGAMHDHSPWERDGREVTVLDPDSARGIEFDAVVVVEPADFKQNYGHHGPLYTALTRPNRELVVVHSKGLPRNCGRGRTDDLADLGQSKRFRALRIGGKWFCHGSAGSHCCWCRYRTGTGGVALGGKGAWERSRDCRYCARLR